MALDAEKLSAAYARVRAWRVAPNPSPSCPVCGADGLVIEDRSVRPYAEWYALSCRTCGLEESLHIPLAPPTDVMG